MLPFSFFRGRSSVMFRRAPKFFLRPPELRRAPRLPPAFCPLRVGKGAEREAESISFQGLSVQPSSFRPCYGTLPRPPACRPRAKVFPAPARTPPRAEVFPLRPACNSPARRACRLSGQGGRETKRCLFGAPSDKIPAFRQTIRRFPLSSRSSPLPPPSMPALRRAPCLPPAFCPLIVGKGAEREAESISFQGLSALPSSLRFCCGTLPRPPALRRPRTPSAQPVSVRAPRRGGSSCFFCVRQRNRVRLFAKRSILRANFRQSADILVTEKKKTAKRLEKKSVFVYNI